MTNKQLSPALKMNTLEPASPQEAVKLSFLAGKFSLHLLLNDPHFTADLSLDLAHIHHSSSPFSSGAGSPRTALREKTMMIEAPGHNNYAPKS